MGSRVALVLFLLAVVGTALAADRLVAGGRSDLARKNQKLAQAIQAKELELENLKKRREELRRLEDGVEDDPPPPQHDADVTGDHEVPAPAVKEEAGQLGGVAVDDKVLPSDIDDDETLGEEQPALEDRDVFSENQPVLSVVRVRGPPKSGETECVRGKSHGAGFAAIVYNKSGAPTAYDGFSNVLGTSANNKQAYAESGVRHIVNRVATEDGFKGTVFVYGQSGSGKTFTMEGTGRSRDAESGNEFGVLQMALGDLFVDLYEKSKEAASTDIQVLPYQLYNNGKSSANVNMDGFRLNKKAETQNADIKFFTSDDVTTPKLVSYDGNGNKLPGLQDPFIPLDLARILPDLDSKSAGERLRYAQQKVGDLIKTWSANRVTEATAMNKQSSRSHMIIEVKYAITSNSGATRTGTLTLVDLAGKELSTSGKNSVAKNQGLAINSSLEALARVISALAAGNKPNLRDSTLTRALDSSFRGHPSEMQTVMIATVSPDEEHLKFTTDTLKYAQEALNIRPADEKPVKKKAPRVVHLRAEAKDEVRMEKRGKNERLDTYVRVRPILPAHESPSDEYNLSCDDEENQCTVTYPETSVDLAVSTKQEVFPDESMSYTGVFSPSDFTDSLDRGPSNEEVFEEVVTNDGKVLDVMLQKPREVSWGTIFCFGYTGTGKTYTMEGDTTDPGLIPRIMDTLFQFKSTQSGWVIKVMDFEIYGDTPTSTSQNTVLRDLLHPEQDSRGRNRVTKAGNTILKTLDVFEVNKVLKIVGSKKIVNKRGVRHDPWVTVTDPAETLRLYRRGGRMREVAITEGNPQGSSRSHRVFRIGLFSSAKQENPRKQITLVDLAGLELMSDTSSGNAKIDGQGTIIRQGLFALKNMIVKIGRNPKAVPTQEIRESQLARILYPALSTSSPSAMIANIAPVTDESSKKRDIITLQYAAAILGKDVPY